MNKPNVARLFIILSFIVAPISVNAQSSSAYCPNLTVDLQIFATNANSSGQVSELQRFLSTYYSIDPNDIVTGYFGVRTHDTVVRFQQEQGLPSFGFVGSLTRAKIARACSTSNDGLSTVSNSGGTLTTSNAINLLVQRVQNLIAAANTAVRSLLDGETLARLLYGSVATSYLHSTNAVSNASTGDASTRTTDVVPCASIPRDRLAVILVIGQSNAANSGGPDSSGKYYESHRRLYDLNIGDGKCYVAKNPLLGATVGTPSYVGRGQAFALPLGDMMVDSGAYSSVLIVPIAVGGSAIEEWQPIGGKHYARIQEAIRLLALQNLEPTYILWQQGESNAIPFVSGKDLDGNAIALTPDVKEAGKLSYVRNLYNIIAAVRKSNVKSPWYIAQSTRCSSAGSVDPVIRSAQQLAVDPSFGIFAGPDTDTLGAEYRIDDCHFNQKGTVAHAVLWARALGITVPDVTLAQSKATTGSGEEFAIWWSAPQATSCTVSKQFPDGTINYSWATGTAGTYSPKTVEVGTHKWWIRCTGLTSSGYAEMSHLVREATKTTATTPTVTISQTKSVTAAGEAWTASWTSSGTGIDSCQLSITRPNGDNVAPFEPPTGRNSSTVATYGDTYNNSQIGSFLWKWRCHNSAGWSSYALMTHNVTAAPPRDPNLVASSVAPTVTLTQDKVTTSPGESLTLSWASSGASACTMEIARPNWTYEGPFTPTPETGGSTTMSLTMVGTHVWKYRCTNAAGTSNTAVVYHVVEPAR